MAKVSRDMLKSLVKECLFEILLESTADAGTSLIESSKEKQCKRRKAKTSKRVPNRPALDSISFNKQRKQPEPRRGFDASSITTDPVMASIFEDTAMTTLVEQAAAERGRPGQTTGPGIALDGIADSSPFGEASKNWAHLAFPDEK